MFALKLSRNELHAIVVILWAKRHRANQIYSEMHLMYGDKCL